MKFVPLSHRWSKGKSRSSDKKSEKRFKRSFLHLEGLEDRCTPSILFGNTPGLTTSDGHGLRLTNAQVRLVFWGNGWNSGGGPALRTQMINDVNTLNTSTYFYSSLPGADLSQYVGSSARPTVVGTFTDTFNSPGLTFTDGDVRTMLSHEFGSAPGFYYYVIPDANSTPTGCGCTALHTFFTVGGTNLHYGWSRNLATPSIDDLTLLYSHEMTESITDPEGTAWQVNPRNPSSWNEVSDGEAQNYAYRVSGVWAQSYWSQANGKFTVPTGQSQNFLVSASRVLTVNGDQLANRNDTVTLDVSGGGVRVTLNGDVAQFEPGAITSIVVFTGVGTNTVNVLRTVVPVRVLPGGSETVTIGVGGSVQGIQAAVTVDGTTNRDALVIDDSADSANRTVSVNGSGVTISGAAPINTGSFWISTLSLRGGTGNNTYTINGVPAFTSMALDTGSGADTMNVLATGVPLAVNTTTGSGGSGNDVVNIGNAGSMTGITGAVTILNNPSRDHVVINDSADGANRSVTINTNGVSFSGLGAINFTSFSVTTLAVSGGTGANSYTINGTPAVTSVTLDTGAGVDTTNVQTTSVPTAVNTTTSPGGSNNDVVNLGNAGSLAGIQGVVTILNNPSRDHVVVNDSADSSNRSIAISDTGVSVSGSAAINFTSFSVVTLVVDAGSGTNTYTINGTPATTSVTLDTGSGVDTTNVLATSVPTTVNTLTSPGGSGNDVVNLGNAGTLGGIQGAVTIFNSPSFDQVNIDDSADSVGRTVTIGSSGVNVSGSAAINFTSFSVSSLTVLGGSGGNSFAVTGSPAANVIVNTGAGGDSVVVSNGGVLDGIGHVTVSDGSGTSSVTVDDSGFGGAEDYVMSNTDVTISRSGFFDLSYSGVGGLTLNGGQASGTFFDIDSTSVPTTVNGGAGMNCFHISPFTQYLAGSIVGPLTLNGSGNDILDFFDQNDPASETFTFDATPSTLTISTGTIATFSGISSGGIYVETNGFSTPNDASGTVNFDVPPPCAPGGGSRPTVTPPVASSSSANVAEHQSQTTETAQPALPFATVHAKAAAATADYLAILDAVFSL